MAKMPARDDPDWDDFRYFLGAARAKTLAGAARAMGVEHTTIGRRLSALERALGVALVLRGPEGLRLTPVGEKVAPLVEEAERAMRAARELAAREKARVRIAVPSGFTRYFAKGLAQVRQTVVLEILSGSRPVDLKKSEADLAIRIGPVTDKDLVVRKVGEAGWSLYASQAYLARRPAPRSLDDLTGHDVIAYDAALAATPAAKWIEDRAANATIVLRSREMTDMLAAATSGLGLAALPCSLGESDPTLKRLTLDVIATRPLSLVCRPEAHLSKEVRAVMRLAAEAMREHGAEIRGRP